MIPLPKAADSKSQKVIELCQKIAPGSKPIYLSLEAMSGAIVNECYGNVEKMIKNKGGTIQYGWQIWETLPELLIEAQFHAVWVDDTEIFHDVTPKDFPTIDKILFLSDSTRKFTGQQVNSFRLSLKSDPLVEEYIKREEEYFKITNEGSLANQFGIINTPEVEEAHSRKVMALVAVLQKYFLKG